MSLQPADNTLPMSVVAKAVVQKVMQSGTKINEALRQAIAEATTSPTTAAPTASTNDSSMPPSATSNTRTTAAADTSLFDKINQDWEARSADTEVEATLPRTSQPRRQAQRARFQRPSNTSIMPCNQSTRPPVVPPPAPRVRSTRAHPRGGRTISLERLTPGRAPYTLRSPVTPRSRATSPTPRSRSRTRRPPTSATQTSPVVNAEAAAAAIAALQPVSTGATPTRSVVARTTTSTTRTTAIDTTTTDTAPIVVEVSSDRLNNFENLAQMAAGLSDNATFTFTDPTSNNVRDVHLTVKSASPAQTLAGSTTNADTGVTQQVFVDAAGNLIQEEIVVTTTTPPRADAESDDDVVITGMSSPPPQASTPQSPHIVSITAIADTANVSDVTRSLPLTGPPNVEASPPPSNQPASPSSNEVSMEQSPPSAEAGRR